MRDFLKTSVRWLRIGWFWPLALLMFPTCALILDFDDDGTPETPEVFAFDPGPSPSSAIMCDIPIVVVEEGADCASETDVAMGMSLARAAIALNLGETSPIALDFSSSATAACGGQPKKIAFHGPFPQGLVVCLDCGAQIPAVYPDPTNACIAQCKDLIDAAGTIPAEGVDTWCALNARVSTNFDKDGCYEGFCSTAGTPIPDPFDPRKNPETVTWVDFVETSAVAGTLSFEGPETGDFSAGAASEQLITTGDAWVEFATGESGVSHVVGLRTSCDDVTSCPDTDGTLADIPLAISLNADDGVYILVNGEVAAGPFEAYTPGERFRINVVDHNDGTADISFTRLPLPCSPNLPCTENHVYTYTGARPNYPLRVDATFREATATLQGVTIMRIIE